MLVGDTRRDMSKPRRPGERPKRKTVVISVLDYPHVGQKHGGSTSGCFTDALLMSRMLSKFYGFTPPTDEGANGTASPSPRQESGASAEAAEKDGIDVQVREGGGRAAAVGVAPLIKVCCTYSWAKGDFSALDGITFENEVYGATGGGAKAKGLTPSSSFAESPGIGSEEDAEDADCDVTHAADTHTEVVRALRWLTEDAKKGDTLLLYFAGCSTYKVVEGGALEPVLPWGLQLGGRHPRILILRPPPRTSRGPRKEHGVRAHCDLRHLPRAVSRAAARGEVQVGGPGGLPSHAGQVRLCGLPAKQGEGFAATAEGAGRGEEAE